MQAHASTLKSRVSSIVNARRAGVEKTAEVISQISLRNLLRINLIRKGWYTSFGIMSSQRQT